MIVRKLADGRLFCMNQTSHALMAAQFCRAWGNETFVPPQPADILRMAVTQHDNGWYEWEIEPKLRADGVPMDFVHDDDPVAKVDLWRRGIARAALQHPYAGVLISGHATRLYGVYAGHGLAAATRQAIQAFVDDHARSIDILRAAWADQPDMLRWLEPAYLEANISLLQFCDVAALQVQMPWERRRVFAAMPVDYAGATADIVMEWTDDVITLAPWPYRVPTFTVTVHGKRLPRQTFADIPDYHQALADAPVAVMTWRVAPA